MTSPIVLLLTLLLPIIPALASLTLIPRSGNVSLTLPSSDLPLISPPLSLKYVALGIGTQNYTCASTPNSPSAPPVSVGAKAILFDVATLFEKQPQLIASLPCQALQYQNANPSSLNYPHMGTHFFNAALQPVFDLTAVNSRLVAKKLNNVPAPANACPNSVVGAVDWLELMTVGIGSFGGVTYAYRVETAGGKAPTTCQGQTGAFQVSYAAEYWFYGP